MEVSVKDQMLKRTGPSALAIIKMSKNTRPSTPTKNSRRGTGANDCIGRTRQGTMKIHINHVEFHSKYILTTSKQHNKISIYHPLVQYYFNCKQCQQPQ